MRYLFFPSYLWVACQSDTLSRYCFGIKIQLFFSSFSWGIPFVGSSLPNRVGCIASSVEHEMDTLEEMRCPPAILPMSSAVRMSLLLFFSLLYLFLFFVSSFVDFPFAIFFSSLSSLSSCSSCCCCCCSYSSCSSSCCCCWYFSCWYSFFLLLLLIFFVFFSFCTRFISRRAPRMAEHEQL